VPSRKIEKYKLTLIGKAKDENNLITFEGECFKYEKSMILIVYEKFQKSRT
jgi:hypothetical protein